MTICKYKNEGHPSCYDKSCGVCFRPLVSALDPILVNRLRKAVA